MNRLFSLLNRQVGGLHQAAYLLALATLASQVLALLRDHLLAGAFGASSLLDVYYGAFRVPDFLFLTVGSLASVAILIPFLVEREAAGRAETERFIGSVFWCFLSGMLAVCAVAFVFMSFISRHLFPGFTASELALTVRLSRLLLLSPILLGLSNLFGSITQIRQKFLLYSLSPVLYNLGIISGVVVFYPLMGPIGLAFGVVLGAACHCGIQLPFLAKEKYLGGLSQLKINFNEVRGVLKLCVPRALALSMSSISAIVLTALASLMTSGSIAIYTFAYNMQSVIYSTIGVSYATAAFPTLATLFSSGDQDRFRDHLAVTTRHIIFWSLPATALIIVLRAQIVRTILGSGQFTWTDTRLVAATLALFIISLMFQGLVILFTRSFYAEGKTGVPLLVNLISTAVLVASSVGLISLFKHDIAFQTWLENLLKINGLPGAEVVLLALGYSFGMAVNAILHFVAYGRKNCLRLFLAVWRSFLEVVLASALGGGAAYTVLWALGANSTESATLSVFIQGFLAGITGLLFIALAFQLLGNQEWQETVGAFHRRLFKRTSPLGSETREL